MSTVAYVASRNPIPQIAPTTWRPSLRHMNVDYTMRTSQVLPQAVGPDPVGAVTDRGFRGKSGSCEGTVPRNYLNGTLPAMPMTTSPTTRTFPVTFIADSGAVRTIYSERALAEQGVPTYLIRKLEANATEGISFVTGGGDRESSKSLGISSSLLGNAEAYKLKDAPFAAALGLIVENCKFPFIWIPADKPYFCTNMKKLKVFCPLRYRRYAT